MSENPAHTPAHQPAIDQALAEVARVSAEAERLTAQVSGAGAALVPTAGGLPAEAYKGQMIAARVAAAAKAAELTAAQTRARELIEAQRRALAAQLHAMTAALEPLQEQVRRMNEGIWTVNLYLGTEEEIVQLTDGESAPAGTPIHVRQLVLAMDEESALFPDEGGMDFRDLAAFDAWVTVPGRPCEPLTPPRPASPATEATSCPGSEPSRMFCRQGTIPPARR